MTKGVCAISLRLHAITVGVFTSWTESLVRDINKYIGEFSKKNYISITILYFTNC